MAECLGLATRQSNMGWWAGRLRAAARTAPFHHPVTLRAQPLNNCKRLHNMYRMRNI
jgi:hypothetical protein